MKYLKRYKLFIEDGTATANASTTAGMGAVSSAQPGAVPGMAGTEGSGDIPFYFKKGKRKKGNPSQVTDMRDLEPAKGVTKVKESLSKSEEYLVAEDCLQELYDNGFEINEMNFDSTDEEYDIDDDNQGTFKSQEIRISLFKQVEKVWRGNLNLRYNFDSSEVYQKHTSTLRPGGSKLEQYESEIVELAEDASHKLINHLEYTSGILTINFEAPGLGVNFNRERHINVNIHIVLNRNVYPTNESYNNIDEYVNEIKQTLSNWNIRPLVLDKLLTSYSDKIEEYFNDGKSTKFFTDEIIKELELDKGGFMSQKIGASNYNQTIKYL